jgi:uncharacterized membrane protein YdjX (TVP38/TMEM64 family)
MLVRAAVLLALAVVGALLCQFSGVKAWLAPAGQMAGWIRQAGVVGSGLFVSGSAALIVAGVPRLLFCLVAGAVYGFWLGLGLSLVATMLGYCGAFVFVRGRQRTSRPAEPLSPRLAFLAQDPGLGGVVLARMLPMPGMVITLALALSAVSFRDYVVGSLIGLIPEAAPVVLLGAGLLAPETSSAWRTGLLVVVCLIMAAAAGVWLLKRRGQPHRPQVQSPTRPLAKDT